MSQFYSKEMEMKNIIKTGSFLLIAAAFIFSVTSCSEEDVQADETSNINTRNLQSQLSSLPTETLSIEEESSILFMREEEKPLRNKKLFQNLT